MPYENHELLDVPEVSEKHTSDACGCGGAGGLIWLLLVHLGPPSQGLSVLGWGRALAATGAPCKGLGLPVCGETSTVLGRESLTLVSLGSGVLEVTAAGPQAEAFTQGPPVALHVG